MIARDDEPHRARQIQVQAREEALQVRGREVEVHGVDAHLRDGDERQAEDPGETDDRHGQRALLAGELVEGDVERRHEQDADQAVHEERQQVVQPAERDRPVVALVLGPREAGEVEREHHEDPDAHVGGEALQPGQRGARRGLGAGQEAVVTAVGERPDDDRDQADDVERQQPAVQAVEPGAHALPHQRGRHGDDDRVPQVERAAEELLRRDRDDRALEHEVVDAGRREDERRDARAHEPEHAA